MIFLYIGDNFTKFFSCDYEAPFGWFVLNKRVDNWFFIKICLFLFWSCIAVVDFCCLQKLTWNKFIPGRYNVTIIIFFMRLWWLAPLCNPYKPNSVTTTLWGSTSPAFRMKGSAVDRSCGLFILWMIFYKYY